MGPQPQQNVSLTNSLEVQPDILVDNNIFSHWPHADVANMSEARIVLNEAERLIAEQQKRIAQLESLALTDELTGLYNRRGLMLALRRELSMAARHTEAEGMLILCDLDEFKKVNDVHGHNAGDAYLRMVATSILEEVRPSDVVARIGGDEFVILLTRINRDNGFARLFKLDNNLHARSLTLGKRTLPLRVSFGATSYGKDDTPEALLAAADLRLYAKKSRRSGG